jgi:hypothetical protein
MSVPGEPNKKLNEALIGACIYLVWKRFFKEITKVRKFPGSACLVDEISQFVRQSASELARVD